MIFHNGKYKVELARHRSGLKLRKEERGISKTVLMVVEKTGRSVVCTDAHGNRDFCRDGDNCLIVDPDPDSVRAALRDIV